MFRKIRTYEWESTNQLYDKKSRLKDFIDNHIFKIFPEYDHLLIYDDHCFVTTPSKKEYKIEIYSGETFYKHVAEISKKIDFEDVIEKFENEYFRKLCIEHHLFELFFKFQKYISENDHPFTKNEFMKELADLFILLELEREHNTCFDDKIEERREKFIEKLKEEYK